MHKTLNDSLIKKITDDAISVWPKNFETYESVVNACCLSICLDILKRFGIFTKVGEAHTFNELKKIIKLSNQAEYLFSKILYILIEEGVLSFANETYTRKTMADYEHPIEFIVRLTRTYPEEGAPFQWLARAYSGMYDVLCGNVYPEDILFPWGSFELVEEFYNTSKVYGFYSELGGFAVKRLIEEVYKSDVKIFEVGAGTGNGTNSVLNKIKAGISKYMYTDVSRTLIKGAKKKFVSYDFMEYALFDASKNLDEQNIESDLYDIVYAVNVIHATNDLKLVLKNLRAILKPGGTLVLAEIAPPPGTSYRFMDMTFGLLPSYSTYKDKDIRPISPIIRPEKWKEIFQNAGFKETVCLPYETTPGGDRGGVVLGVK